MNVFELFLVKIIIFLRLDKVIDSCKHYIESRDFREDQKKERNLRSLANFSKNMGHDYFADYFEKEANIIKNRSKKNENN
jgi:hypothetical protein